MAAKLQLPNVTLLTATSVNVDEAHAALLFSTDGIDFGAVRMLSSTRPAVADPRIDYVRIPPMDLIGYSRLMIETLHEFVETDHCLVVQADGFVMNPTAWRDEFLDYDYIGAPWPELLPTNTMTPLRLGKNRVGNGGFSLRSRKLLAATPHLPIDDHDFPTWSEDLLICHFLHDEMTAAGIRFAPPELAACFSVESETALYGQSVATSFGFHGQLMLGRNRRPDAPITWGEVSRNEPCPCGSGKRYKHCHGAF